MRLLLGAFIVLLLLLQYEFWFSDGGMRTVWSLQRNITDQKNINAQLEKRNQVLIAEVKDLQSGDAAIEARARNDLGMIKKDEVFYRVIQLKHSEADTRQASAGHQRERVQLKHSEADTRQASAGHQRERVQSKHSEAERQRERVSEANK